MTNIIELNRRNLLIAGSTALAIRPATVLSAAPAARAHFLVTLQSLKPLRFLIDARLPIDGDKLEAAQTYPAELPQMAQSGWPVLVKELRVRDSDGATVPVRQAGDSGWTLGRKVIGHVTLRYFVDFSIFQEAGWSSPRESAFADPHSAVVACRALFLTTSKSDRAFVRFRLPQGWQPIAPWPTIAGGFDVASKADLTENMLVVSGFRPDIVSAAGMTMSIATLGQWRTLRNSVGQALSEIVKLQAGMIPVDRRESYAVILIPATDIGGDAYRQSFVYSHNGPSDQNRNRWANTIAHETFHYWNGLRLRGPDYASTQWFQEGFTEYVANRCLVVGRIASPDWFQAKLAEHIGNYRRLETTLEAIGTRKGPPLYSAGALVALAFDTSIRDASAGQRSLGDFFRNLWRATSSGERPYSWPDIEAALSATAPGSWSSFYHRHIRGDEKLPLDSILRRLGLRLVDGNVVADPRASAQARALVFAMSRRL